MFVAAEHMDRLQETHLEGPADLVVEILPPESLGWALGEILRVRAAGIPEYWLIDPEGEQAEFYVLGRQSRAPTGVGRHRGHLSQFGHSGTLAEGGVALETAPHTGCARELGILPG